jgi:hypothetical protein
MARLRGLQSVVRGERSPERTEVVREAISCSFSKIYLEPTATPGKWAVIPVLRREMVAGVGPMRRIRVRDGVIESRAEVARLQPLPPTLAGRLLPPDDSRANKGESTKTWQDGLTAGRGFVAVAIVIFALWRPVRAILGALLFAGAIAVGLQLQASGSTINPFLLDMLPYAATIVVVVWGRAKAFTVPAGLREVFAGTAK